MRLHGVDLYVGRCTRQELAAAVARLEPSIAHLFFEDEDLDGFLAAIGVADLAKARALDTAGGLGWLLDIEMTTPVPTERIAARLSLSGLLVARPSDEAAQYSSYLVYEHGALAYEAELQDEDTAPRLLIISGRRA